MDEEYDPTWTLRCDGGNSEKRRQRFARLARRAIVALGLKFDDPIEALDAWLNRLHRFHWGLKTRFGRAHWRVSHVAEAAAEYCAELNTRFHEAGDAEAERRFEELDREFRELEDPDDEFVAHRRRNTCLNREDYPFTSWLYDHAHEALPDPKAELDYWSGHIWGFYHARIEHWNHLDRTGPAWAALPEKLKEAAGGLSCDFAVLQANHIIDRGLRDDNATGAFDAEAPKLLEQVAAVVRASWNRLGLSFADGGSEDARLLAEPFDRVRNDLLRLIPELPPVSSFQFHIQSVAEISATPSPTSPSGGPTGSQQDDRDTAAALAAGFCIPASFGENPFTKDDPQHSKWEEFATVNCERVTHLVTGLRELRDVVDEASYDDWRSRYDEAPEVYDPERIERWLDREGIFLIRDRFDRTIAAALQMFLQGPSDLPCAARIIETLAGAMRETLGQSSALIDYEQWKEWKFDFAKDIAENFGLPPKRWRIDPYDRGREQEKRLAPLIARLMKAAGVKFEHDRQAVDACLDLLCDEGLATDKDNLDSLGESIMTLCERLEIDHPSEGPLFMKLHAQFRKLAAEGVGDCTAIRLAAPLLAATTNSAGSQVAGSGGIDFSSETERNLAITEYIDHWTTDVWTCTAASLARTAGVDPADLSKWKKGRLPVDSDKAGRIEKALRENQKPIPPPNRAADF